MVLYKRCLAASFLSFFITIAKRSVGAVLKRGDRRPTDLSYHRRRHQRVPESVVLALDVYSPDRSLTSICLHQKFPLPLFSVPLHVLLPVFLEFFSDLRDIKAHPTYFVIRRDCAPAPGQNAVLTQIQTQVHARSLSLLLFFLDDKFVGLLNCICCCHPKHVKASPT